MDPITYRPFTHTNARWYF